MQVSSGKRAQGATERKYQMFPRQGVTVSSNFETALREFQRVAERKEMEAVHFMCIADLFPNATHYDRFEFDQVLERVTSKGYGLFDDTEVASVDDAILCGAYPTTQRGSVWCRLVSKGWAQQGCLTYQFDITGKLTACGYHERDELRKQMRFTRDHGLILRTLVIH